MNLNVTGTEAEVCLDIAKRQQVGIRKYGTTVRTNPLKLIEWLQHAYEEALDLAVYLKRVIEELTRGADEPGANGTDDKVYEGSKEKNTMLLQKEKIAKVCHEVNRAYCRSLGDNSQVAWEDAPQWQRESAIKGVEFNLANPDAPESATHDAWLEVKKAEGWKYGAVKDVEKKEHPCYVPYDQLPKDQQCKDALFKAVVLALAASE